MTEVFVRAQSTWTAERGAPRAELIPVAHRRRCSLATRIVAEVTGDLVAAGLPLAQAAIVHGTAFGEIATTAELLDMMRDGDGELSPLRFATSVHNAAAGQLAIAVGHTGVSTTVSAGPQTCAAAWMEALGLLAEGFEDVLVVVADEPMPSSMPPRHDGVGVGWWLSRQVGTPCVTRARWRGPQRGLAAVRVPAALQGSALRFAWALAQGIGGQGRVRLEPDDARGYAACVELLGG